MKARRLCLIDPLYKWEHKLMIVSNDWQQIWSLLKWTVKASKRSRIFTKLNMLLKRKRFCSKMREAVIKEWLWRPKMHQLLLKERRRLHKHLSKRLVSQTSSLKNTVSKWMLQWAIQQHRLHKLLKDLLLRELKISVSKNLRIKPKKVWTLTPITSMPSSPQNQRKSLSYKEVF